MYFLEEFLGKPEDKLNNTPKFAQYVKDKLLESKQIGGVVLTDDPAGLARNTQTEDGVNNFTIIHIKAKTEHTSQATPSEEPC